MSDRAAQKERAEELAHQHAVRALDQQAGVLDNLRARTGVMVAIASLAATFLGGQALHDEQDAPVWLDWLAIAPLTALLATVVFATRVLQPTAKPDRSMPRAQQEALRFSLDANAILATADDPTADDIRGEVARSAQQMWERNQGLIEAKMADFTMSTWALFVQLALWIGLLIAKGVA